MIYFCAKIEPCLFCNEQISCQEYYFSETITETEVVIIFFFQSLLRACTYKKGTRWNKMKVKEQGGREKQVGATPHLKSAKHRVRRTNFFGILCAFLVLLSFTLLLSSYFNYNFFRKYEPRCLTLVFIARYFLLFSFIMLFFDCRKIYFTARLYLICNSIYDLQFSVYSQELNVNALFCVEIELFLWTSAQASITRKLLTIHK